MTRFRYSPGAFRTWLQASVVSLVGFADARATTVSRTRLAVQHPLAAGVHVDPLPASEQPAARSRAGRWAFCPQAAWAFEVMTRAQAFLLGPRREQAILGKTGKRSFALWTTATRPQVLGPCMGVAGATVCRIGDRLAWAVQGLWLWVEPAPSPYASLRTTPGVPTGSTLERLVQPPRSIRLVAPYGAGTACPWDPKRRSMPLKPEDRDPFRTNCRLHR
jgi:hypothetical protein